MMQVSCIMARHLAAVVGLPIDWRIYVNTQRELEPPQEVSRSCPCMLDAKHISGLAPRIESLHADRVQIPIECASGLAPTALSPQLAYRNAADSWSWGRSPINRSQRLHVKRLVHSDQYSSDRLYGIFECPCP